MADGRGGGDKQPHTTPHMAGLARMAFCVVYARFKALVRPGNRFPVGEYAPTVIQPNSAANRSFSAPPRLRLFVSREAHPLLIPWPIHHATRGGNPWKRGR